MDNSDSIENIRDFVGHFISDLKEKNFFEKDVYGFCPEKELTKELFDSIVSTLDDNHMTIISDDFLEDCINRVAASNVNRVLEELISKDEVTVSVDENGEFVYTLKNSDT